MSHRDAQLAVPNARRPAAIEKSLSDKLYRDSGATKWNLPVQMFEAALGESVVRRFAGQSPAHAEIKRYLESLHIQDLALAVACRSGSEAAWDHFVAEFRP